MNQNEKTNEVIIAIDLSSVKIKVALVSVAGRIMSKVSKTYNIYSDESEKTSGLGLYLDPDEIWLKIISCIEEIIKKSNIKEEKIIALSSCAQRIAIVFLDQSNKPIYIGPNKDIRGIDSQWIIDDEYASEDEEKRLFSITAHNPPLIFGLARILWFREEEKKKYDKINKILMLDDWIQYKLSGMIISDTNTASDSQILNISQREWSKEIIERFNLDPNWFPQLIEPGKIVGDLQYKVAKQLGISTRIPVIKSGADTQTNLIGMGCIENGQVGINLGSTAPIMIVVDDVKIDPDMNFWTNCYTMQKWAIEANIGGAGQLYEWYKENFLFDLAKDPNLLIESYLSSSKPGANSTFAYLGPELINYKNQTEFKRSVFVFPPQNLITDIVSNRFTFARAVLENIAFGILENFNALKKFAPSNKIESVFCCGGMANSKEFLSIISNVLNHDLYVPKIIESAYIGQLINCLIALKRYPNYKKALENIVNYEKIHVDPIISTEYKSIYSTWKKYKDITDKL